MPTLLQRRIPDGQRVAIGAHTFTQGFRRLLGAMALRGQAEFLQGLHKACQALLGLGQGVAGTRALRTTPRWDYRNLGCKAAKFWGKFTLVQMQ